MAEELILNFPPETLKLIENRMDEEGISNRNIFLAELLTRALTRRLSTHAWESVIERIVADSMNEEEGTILIYPSDADEN
ncbi:hypothetical protein [Methanocorpusculum vombati]|uniref:Ribbon-helix-helix protein CopG domain-containing protein n=1 Tax=Methanocorpusculum vombati TaxID=3002864 RepID=A0ABT4IJI8_9EURY|nr:hypothetical protein [Methanocorpusculum vombati]MCZ9320167.1 hypothetical protein [Methanocorpusculum sp.]MCZ0861902.1 hypothetical protein [Methanocorpusculum vombati]MDE2519931.1 hypothetical protein [Methanocorpusculum sp.]MDE2533569.1 hypothetical protein [Methanocorpusculum sp.]MDE2545664.1 hypothetical protein [Methanocorpusculum sp.]